MPISLSGSLVLTGSLTTTSTITAQTLVVQTITSSISSITGSTNFGTLSSNTHTFTGSLNVSGSTHTILGNVGIGTSSPSQKLSIGTIVSSGTATSTPTCITLDDTFGNNTIGTNFKLKIFQDNAINRYGLGISDGLYEIVAGTSGSIAFFTNGASEKMRITTDGNVGIGTTSPSQKLEVVGGEIKAGRVDTNQEGGQVSFGRASDNNTTWYIDAYGSSTSPQLRFVDVDNSAVRMVLTGSNVGIGTTSPSGLLHLAIGNNQKILNMTGATNGFQYMQMSNTSGNLLIGVEGSTTGNIATGDLAYSSVICTANTSALQFGVNQAVSMTLVNGGNVGIRTSSPQATLSIKGAANNTVIEFENGGATKAFMRSYDRTAGAYREYEMLAEYLLFSAGTSPSERMRIASDGSVIIGATSMPNGQKVGIVGSGVWDGAALGLQNTGTGGTTYTIFSTNSSFSQGAGNFLLYNASGGVNNLIVYANGNYAFAGSNVSDRRLKQDIENINFGLNEIMQLSPKSYNLKSSNNLSGENQTTLKKRYGFIAQEVQTILPYTITGTETETEYLGLDYNGVLTVAVKAIQELKAENDSLKSRIEILENK